MDEIFNLDCLKSHNELRLLHKVPPLKLSVQLAEDAQLWADIISKKSNQTKKKSSDIYGENINYSDYIETGEETTLKWYQEIYDYKFGQERQNLAAIRHFAQIIWNDTSEVGFGRNNSDTGQWVVVARYKKPGNIVGKFMQNIHQRIIGWENYPIIIKLKNMSNKDKHITIIHNQENKIPNNDRPKNMNIVVGMENNEQKNIPINLLIKSVNNDIDMVNKTTTQSTSSMEAGNSYRLGKNNRQNVSLQSIPSEVHREKKSLFLSNENLSEKNKTPSNNSFYQRDIYRKYNETSYGIEADEQSFSSFATLTYRTNDNLQQPNRIGINSSSDHLNSSNKHTLDKKSMSIDQINRDNSSSRISLQKNNEQHKSINSLYKDRNGNDHSWGQDDRSSSSTSESSIEKIERKKRAKNISRNMVGNKVYKVITLNKKDDMKYKTNVQHDISGERSIPKRTENIPNTNMFQNKVSYGKHDDWITTSSENHIPISPNRIGDTNKTFRLSNLSAYSNDDQRVYKSNRINHTHQPTNYMAKHTYDDAEDNDDDDDDDDDRVFRFNNNHSSKKLNLLPNRNIDFGNKIRNNSKQNTGIYNKYKSDKLIANEEIVEPKTVRSDFAEMDLETDANRKGDIEHENLYEFRQNILIAHNECRKFHKVKPLKFNPTLTRMAQQWANHVSESKQLGYSNQIYKGIEVGENIVLQMKGSSYFSIQNMVKNWYNEKENFKYGSEPKNIEKIGHFSQMVWSATEEIGIGISTISNYAIIVCFYFPPGNTKGEFAKNVVPLLRK